MGSTKSRTDLLLSVQFDVERRFPEFFIAYSVGDGRLAASGSCRRR